MAHYVTTVASRRSAQETFDFMSDFSTTQVWDPGVVRARRLDDGPIGRGSKFHVVTLFFGREIPLDYEIIEFEPGRKMVLEAQTNSVRSTDTITIRESGSGATLTYDARLVSIGAYAFMKPLLAIAFRQIGERARAGLIRNLG